MRIAVIADTHDHYPPRFPQRLAAADEIWHLGDVCARTTLIEFENLGVPLQVVLGNNEDHEHWPPELLLERAEQKFFLTHIPPDHAPEGVQFVLHGHTHVPRDELDAQGVRWLNPGCITRPNRGARASFAWLTIEKGKPVEWRVVPV